MSNIKIILNCYKDYFKSIEIYENLLKLLNIRASIENIEAQRSIKIVFLEDNVDVDIFITFFKEKCYQLKIKNSIETKININKDQVFIENHKIRNLGNKFTIVPLTKKDQQVNYIANSDRQIVKIYTNGPFGTGKHPTTDLCINALEKYLIPKTKMLDIGCDSSILGIVALLLGAEEATGVDIENSAVTCAYENAKINKVENRYKSFQSNLTESVNEKYDLVIANILANPIKKLIKHVSKYLNDNGTLILSDIANFRDEEIKTVLKDNNFQIIEHNQKNHWSSFIIKKA